MKQVYDVIIIGGGIVGLATALELQNRNPDAAIVVLEKEPQLASHQSGHNSGVIHAGVYYAPGSLKARFCREGVAATTAFCDEHAIPYSICGKLIVATDEAEAARLDALHDRASQNGIRIEPVSGDELHRLEPHIAGVKALHSPTTGIVDYGRVARKMGEVFAVKGGTIITGITAITCISTSACLATSACTTCFAAITCTTCVAASARHTARVCDTHAWLTIANIAIFNDTICTAAITM